MESPIHPGFPDRRIAPSVGTGKSRAALQSSLHERSFCLSVSGWIAPSAAGALDCSDPALSRSMDDYSARRSGAASRNRVNFPFPISFVAVLSASSSSASFRIGPCSSSGEIMRRFAPPPASPLYVLFLYFYIKIRVVCGGCGQRGARWETRSVFHGKRPGSPQANCPQLHRPLVSAR